MTKETRLELIQEAKELGLRAITIEGVTYEIRASGDMNVEPLIVPDLEASALLSPESVFDSLTDEEILFWSTPEYDAIQEKKQQHQEHLKNKEVNNG